MKQNKTNLQSLFTVRRMVLVGVLSALVFALSSISIQLGDISRIHFGNIMCLLSGVLFGPWIGGLSAGLGSMFYDFTNPLYISEFWLTFITKFAMGFVAGWLHRHYAQKLHGSVRNLLPALGGSLTYVVLYCVKNLFWQWLVYGIQGSALIGLVATKGAISLVNGAIAVVAVTLLAPVLRAALERSHFLPKIRPTT